MSKRFIPLLLFVVCCTHDYERKQVLDTTQVAKAKENVHTEQAPSKITEAYTDEKGVKHPKVIERGGYSRWAIKWNNTTTNVHWYDWAKSKWKFGLPIWLWITIGAILVGGIIYVFHHFTLIGRLKALWNKTST